MLSMFFSIKNQSYVRLILRKNLPQNQKVYNEPFFHYRALPDEKDLTVYGYFQSEKYIDKDFIRELFAIDEETKLYIRHKYQDILNKNRFLCMSGGEIIYNRNCIMLFVRSDIIKSNAIIFTND